MSIVLKAVDRARRINGDILNHSLVDPFDFMYYFYSPPFSLRIKANYRIRHNTKEAVKFCTTWSLSCMNMQAYENALLKYTLKVSMAWTHLAKLFKYRANFWAK